MSFWWCPFPVLLITREKLRHQGVHRWSDQPATMPPESLVIAPAPQDVLLAWSDMQGDHVLDMASLQGGYTQIRTLLQTTRHELFSPEAFAATNNASITELIGQLNQEHPDILAEAYRLRKESPEPRTWSQDPVRSWCSTQQDMRLVIRNQRSLLEQHRHQHHESRKFIRELIKKIN